MTRRAAGTGILAAPEPLAPHHELDAFESGVATLDEWLKRRARRNEADGASRTFVLCTGRRVVGYYSLAAGSVLRHARANLANTLIAGLMLIAASFVGSIGSVACGVGFFVTSAYALAMQAWIIRSFEMGSHAAAAA